MGLRTRSRFDSEYQSHHHRTPSLDKVQHSSRCTSKPRTQVKEGKKTSPASHAAIPRFPLLGRSSFELLSSDQPPRLKSGAKSFQPSARQSKSVRLCAFQASSPGLACEFIPTTCLPLFDVLLLHQRESGRIDRARPTRPHISSHQLVSPPALTSRQSAVRLPNARHRVNLPEQAPPPPSGPVCYLQ